MSTKTLWPAIPVSLDAFRRPPRAYGILPFWFLNGALDPAEMRFQLKELYDKGMAGVILHGRYGLEMPYLSPQYLDRIALAVEEAASLGLPTWIYDEMNWPSGTADLQVLHARPDLAQRYLECISFTVRGPWFTYLTGADSRYLDFERSTPVAAFALGADGRVIDLTPNLSFTDVIPWEAPPGNWRLMYIVEKRADYYIDALNPEATAEFLRLGYAPYAATVGKHFSQQMMGFYTDEPAMHYYLSGADTPIIPWTSDMFRRFQERCGYSLRPRLPDLFFDVRPDSARVRFDYYTTLTEFYSDAYYRQIHEWCQDHGVLFTGHLLYEEWLRRLIRVEGNLFRHYAHMDVVGVDHLYPFIGSRDRPDEHVAIKVASSGAHHLGSPRLLCESFGGIFMDATMQRMKWIADWEYVLGVNLLNPHGFHYTLEGPRKRDWPPSQFYQYPWWRYYRHFSDYISRLSHLLSGGRHVAKVAVLWPLNSLFATYTPQSHNALADRTEQDFNVLTDLLLRLHYDFDYLDEDILATAELTEGKLQVDEERYELLVLPPLTHIKLSTLEQMERFAAAGGRLLGLVFLPTHAFYEAGMVDVTDRVQMLFGVDPRATQAEYRRCKEITVTQTPHPHGGLAAFFHTYALARQLPWRLQELSGMPGQPSSPYFSIEGDRYFYTPPDGERQEITAEVQAERNAVMERLGEAIAGLIAPDIRIDNPEVFYLHRVKDGRDIYFLINPTFAPQDAHVAVTISDGLRLWDPSTGEERPLVPVQRVEGGIAFDLTLPSVGSTFLVSGELSHVDIIAANIVIDHLDANTATGYGTTDEGMITVESAGRQITLVERATTPLPPPLVLDGEWEFVAEGANALVLGQWWTTVEEAGRDAGSYAAPDIATTGWLPMGPGAWSYQLPAEPDRPYPIVVWYRTSFHAAYVPPALDLIIDGFAGSDWQLYVNGTRVTAEPRRSAIDSEMRALAIGDLVRPGENVIALRLTLTQATDGLLDLLKLTGEFSLEARGDGGYQLAAPRHTLQPAPWTEQGYPFFSGSAVYRRRFDLPDGFAGLRIFLEPAMTDDALEVIVNGQTAGVRLWEPYQVEITDFVRPGANVLELRVANTLVNLLEATPRPSGLAGAPRLTPYRGYRFNFRQL